MEHNSRYVLYDTWHLLKLLSKPDGAAKCLIERLIRPRQSAGLVTEVPVLTSCSQMLWQSTGDLLRRPCSTSCLSCLHVPNVIVLGAPLTVTTDCILYQTFTLRNSSNQSLRKKHLSCMCSVQNQISSQFKSNRKVRDRGVAGWKVSKFSSSQCETEVSVCPSLLPTRLSKLS